MLTTAQHVHHLRVPDAVPMKAVLPKPRISDYTFERIATRQAAIQAVQQSQSPTLVGDDRSSAPKAVPEKEAEWFYGEVDWVAYSSAVSNFIVVVSRLMKIKVSPLSSRTNYTASPARAIHSSQT